MRNQNITVGLYTYTVPNPAGLADFHYFAFCAYAENKSRLRFGQVLFSVLCDMRPDLADRVVSTNCDPYYVERRSQLDRFYTFIAANW